MLPTILFLTTKTMYTYVTDTSQSVVFMTYDNLITPYKKSFHKSVACLIRITINSSQCSTNVLLSFALLTND